MRYLSANLGREDFERWNFIQGAQEDIGVSDNQEEQHDSITFLYRLYYYGQNFGNEKYIGIDLNFSTHYFLKLP